MTPTHITSTNNPKIKWVKSLSKNSVRKKEGVFVVEGAKEIALALKGGYEPVALFICPEISNQGQSPITSGTVLDVYTISKDVFEKIAYREGSDGLLAIFQAKVRELGALSFSDPPFFLVVEAIEKPGNLGAILRTADGAGVDAVIVCNQKADMFNPNVIRSSVGTVFTTQVVADSNEAIWDFLQKHEISVFGAILSDDSKDYSSVNFNDPSAIVLGTEHDGLSDFWQQRAQPIKIPMYGTNDSLNVSNAAAVLAYEAVRQRGVVNSE